jgi:hypothetical protein
MCAESVSHRLQQSGSGPPRCELVLGGSIVIRSRAVWRRGSHHHACPSPKGKAFPPLLDTHEGADRSTPVVIQQRTSDAATGSLRPSHEPGGGPEQPVKPGRLGALYTRDVRNSSASGSPARVAERSGKLKERIPPSPPVSKWRHDFWGWRRCVRFSGFRGLDQDQSQPARGTGWRVGRASRRSPVRGRVRSASPGGPGRGPLAGCR